MHTVKVGDHDLQVSADTAAICDKLDRLIAALASHAPSITYNLAAGRFRTEAEIAEEIRLMQLVAGG